MGLYSLYEYWVALAESDCLRSIKSRYSTRLSAINTVNILIVRYSMASIGMIILILALSLLYRRYLFKTLIFDEGGIMHILRIFESRITTLRHWRPCVVSRYFNDSIFNPSSGIEVVGKALSDKRFQRAIPLPLISAPS
jgi:hypothetical protein